LLGCNRALTLRVAQVALVADDHFRRIKKPQKMEAIVTDRHDHRRTAISDDLIAGKKSQWTFGGHGMAFLLAMLASRC
jgi:hypothetical protein